MIKLGINIDHVATVRQARRENFPDPLELARAAVVGGAHGITVHLREDRRHIQDSDLLRLKKNLTVPLNMEMAAIPEIVKIAMDVKPTWCCLVPEKRQELTTEGGLDLKGHFSQIQKSTRALQRAGIRVSLFIDPDKDTIEISKELDADAVELHTGPYARAWALKNGDQAQCSGTNLAVRNSVEYELKKLLAAAKLAKSKGLVVNAGHGLDYSNVSDLSRTFDFNEYNIGFAVVARALVVGMEKAVSQMKKLMEQSVCVES